MKTINSNLAKKHLKHEQDIALGASTHLKCTIEFQKGVKCGQVEIMDMLPIPWDSCPFNIIPTARQKHS